VNEKKIIDSIVYPFTSKYPTEYIKVHYCLNNELEDMIERSGYKQNFLKKYQKSLRFLEGLKTRCYIGNSKLFEKLLEEDNLYSIRLFGEKNIRILFTFANINGENKAILLNAFEEKSKSDYEFGIRVANSRKDEIISFYNK
jgi:hypothetical protein